MCSTVEMSSLPNSSNSVDAFVQPIYVRFFPDPRRVCSQATICWNQGQLCRSAQKEMRMAATSFRKVAEKVGLSTSQQKKLLKVSEMLYDANLQYNLTGIRTREGIILKHLVDALTLLPILDKEPPKTIVDVGTGAGFPGLVLAVSRPEWSLTLLDSVRKKLAFHKHVVDELSLRNVQSEWGRAEELGQSHLRENFCVAVARSVAEMRVLAELTLPFVRVGGCVLAQKTVDSQFQEISAANKSIKVCGGRIEHISTAWSSEWKSLLDRDESNVNDKDLDAKRIIQIRKERPTPRQYPRRSGTPKKSPL